MPDSFEEQAELVRSHIRTILAAADVEVESIVSVWGGKSGLLDLTALFISR